MTDAERALETTVSRDEIVHSLIDVIEREPPSGVRASPRLDATGRVRVSLMHQQDEGALDVLIVDRDDHA